MLLTALLNYVTDTTKTAVTSLTGAVVGQVASESGLSLANVALQHAAWVTAILAAILTIVNLFFPLRTFYNEYKERRQEKYLKDE